MNLRILTLTNILLIITHFILLVINYADLPEQVPSHVGLNLKTDAYRHKSFVFPIVILNIIIFAVLEFLKSKPQILNYGVPVTEKNKESLYRGMQKFLSILNLIVTFLFFSTSGYMYLSFNKIFLWFPWGLLIALFIGSAIFVVKQGWSEK